MSCFMKFFAAKSVSLVKVKYATGTSSTTIVVICNNKTDLNSMTIVIIVIGSVCLYVFLK